MEPDGAGQPACPSPAAGQPACPSPSSPPAGWSSPSMEGLHWAASESKEEKVKTLGNASFRACRAAENLFLPCSAPPSCWLISAEGALANFLKIIPLFAKKKSVYGRAVWIPKTTGYNERRNKWSPWDEKKNKSTSPSSRHSAVNKTQGSLILMLPRTGHNLGKGRGWRDFSGSSP